MRYTWGLMGLIALSNCGHEAEISGPATPGGAGNGLACPTLAKITCTRLNLDPVPDNANFTLTFGGKQVLTLTCPGRYVGGCDYPDAMGSTMTCDRMTLPLHQGAGSYEVHTDAGALGQAVTPLTAKADACGLITQWPQATNVRLAP